MPAQSANTLKEALETILPALKPGISIHQGPRSHFGAPTTIIHDPAANEHYRFDWRATEALKNWVPGRSVMFFIEDVNEKSSTNLTPEYVLSLIELMRKNHLLNELTSFDPSIHGSRQPFTLKTVLSKYFYWRVPLVNPDKFLTRIVPFIRPLLTPINALIVCILGLISLYLVGQQWDQYIATLPYMFTVQGALIAVVSIVFIKCWHEFGHGIITKAFGRPVTTMGVAFLFLFPILYTDTSQAWTIRDKRQRMGIDAAGVGVELLLAILATYAWLVTPDGPWRSAFFMMSSTTWVVSLFVNLNPLLKFDGYYLLSDYWNLPNMQSRAHAITQWHIRRRFLNWPGEKPEIFPAKLERKLVIYSIAAMLYRIVIFLSISLVVYAFFFKALGLALVLLNLVWLIILPLAKELTIWWSVRKMPEVQKRRSAWLIGSIIVAAVLFVPTRTVIQAPALMLPEHMTMLYASEAAQLKSFSVETNDLASEGDVIATLSAPELRNTVAVEQARYLEAEKTLQASSVSTLLIQARKRLEEELRLSSERINAAQEQIDALTIAAPYSGTMVWLNTDLRSDEWVEKNEAIAAIADLNSFEITAYIEERDWEKFNACETTLFYPVEPTLAPFEVILSAEASVGGNEVDNPFFASKYGGEIAVREDNEGRLIADTAISALKFKPIDPITNFSRPMKGTVRLCSEPKSIAQSIANGFYVLLVRELGF